jgi:hypothetical protein
MTVNVLWQLWHQRHPHRNNNGPLIHSLSVKNDHKAVGCGDHPILFDQMGLEVEQLPAKADVWMSSRRQWIDMRTMHRMMHEDFRVKVVEDSVIMCDYEVELILQ